MSSGSQPPPAPPAKVAPMPLESQAERRRAQLIRIAAALIETEGIDAVTMASVAELAGCTRTQVHRYFAKREDLLAAVVHDFNDRLRAITRSALYDSYYILHSVPRFNNPSGTFDNDQYLLRIVVPNTFVGTALETFVGDWLDNANNPTVLETF